MNLAQHPLFIWFPVHFGLGVLLYFIFPSDLDLRLCGALFVLALLVYIMVARQPVSVLWHYGCLMAVLVASGLLLAAGRTDYIADAQTGFGFAAEESRRDMRVSGRIIRIEPRIRDTVIVLETTDLAQEKARYARARLYARGGLAEGLQLGCRLDAQVDMRPLRGPVVYRGYDPRFPAFFEGIGAIGFVQQVDARDCVAEQGGMLLRLRVQIEAFRLSMSARFAEHLSPQAAGLASALFLGLRGQLPSDTRAAFRDSGLAHMLAISGLHMALFAGGVYGALRAFLALFTWLVLRVDIRKICAAVALLAATAYLLISGGSIATQRAYVMIFFFLLAILLNRPAISLRNLAWAGLVILMMRPESIMNAGFQMSFVATLALIGFYQFATTSSHIPNLSGLIAGRGRVSRWARSSAYYIGALVSTSIVAGFVTALIAAVHFNRFSSMGLFANISAMPILGALVMPFGFLSFPALLLYEKLPALLQTALSAMLDALSASLNALIGLAHFFAAPDIARIGVGTSPSWVIMLVFVALFLLCMTEGRWRIWGAGVLVLAMIFTGSASRPEAYILGQGYRIAVRDSEGVLGLVPGRGGDFYIRQWYAHEGLAGKARPQLDECTRTFCVIEARDGHKIAIARSVRAVQRSCKIASLVITRLRVDNIDCAAKLITAKQLPRNGVTAIQYRLGTFVPMTVGATTQRHWHRN